MSFFEIWGEKKELLNGPMWHHNDHWFYDIKLVVPKKIYFRTLDTLMIVWLYLWILTLIKITKKNKTYLNYCCVVDRRMGFLHKILRVVHKV
jgi:hypothetical protein